MNIHVDDGNGCGPEQAVMVLMDYVSSKLDIKFSGLIFSGSSYNYLRAEKILLDGVLITVPSTKYIITALEAMGMQNCNESTSPKLDKSWMEGDDELLDDERSKNYKTATCKLIFLSRKRWDIQHPVRTCCQYLKAPSKFADRQLVKLLRYLKGTLNVGHRVSVSDEPSQYIELWIDSDWGGDVVSRRSVSGAMVEVDGAMLHGQCAGQTNVATSSTQAEIQAGTNGLPNAIMMQYLLHFLNLGYRLIRMNWDSSGAVSFAHRQGVGGLKHLEIKQLWIQDLVAKGVVVVRKVPRDINPSDLLTHAPSAPDLQKFMVRIGLIDVSIAKDPLKQVTLSLMPKGNSKQMNCKQLMQAMLLISVLGKAKANAIARTDLQLSRFLLQDVVVMMFGIFLIFVLGMIVGAVVYFKVWKWIEVPKIPKIPARVFYMTPYGEKLHVSQFCSSIKNSKLRVHSTCKLCDV
jgi:hypothetical protein